MRCRFSAHTYVHSFHKCHSSLEFVLTYLFMAWQYLIFSPLKVPGFVAAPSQPAEKAAGRRSSLADMLFSSKRDLARAAHPPDLALRALPVAEQEQDQPAAAAAAAARTLKLHAKTAFSAESATQLQGGPLLHVNYALSAEDSGSSKAARVVGRFFYLVDSRLLAAIDEAVAQEKAAVLAGKTKPAKTRPRPKETRADGDAGCDGAHSLLPVGPVMAAAAMVRWSGGRGGGGGHCSCCAVLMADSAVVNVLQLSLELRGAGPTTRISLHVLASVDLMGGAPHLHSSVTGLLWTSAGGGLLLWAASHSAVSAVAVAVAASVAPTRSADVITWPHMESVSVWPPAAVVDRSRI